MHQLRAGKSFDIQYMYTANIPMPLFAIVVTMLLPMSCFPLTSFGARPGTRISILDLQPDLWKVCD